MNESDTLLELSHSRLESQSGILRHLTTKAGIMLAAATLITGEVIFLEVSGILQMLVLYLISVCVLLCFVCGLAIILPRFFGEGPDLERASEVIENYDLKAAKEWIAAANIFASKHNAKSIMRMERWLVWGLCFLAGSICCLFVFLVIIQIGS